MVRALTTIILTVICFTIARAQEAAKYPVPDYADIERMTKDRSSAFYYNSLFDKYASNDTSLSPREYWMLYYGYYFDEHYTPLQNTEYAVHVMAILNKETLNKEDWKDIAQASKLNLEHNPFDLKGINIAWIAQRQLGDSATARLYFIKLKNLVEVILSTGDGLSEATAFHVLDAAHEYDIVNILGYEFAGTHDLTQNKNDYLTVKANVHHLPGIFFSAGKQADEYIRVAQATVSE